MHQAADANMDKWVTLHVRVWIEMLPLPLQFPACGRHPPREGVD